MKYWIDEYVMGRSVPSKEDFEDLVNSGVKTVISLLRSPLEPAEIKKLCVIPAPRKRQRVAGKIFRKKRENAAHEETPGVRAGRKKNIISV